MQIDDVDETKADDENLEADVADDDELIEVLEVEVDELLELDEVELVVYILSLRELDELVYVDIDDDEVDEIEFVIIIIDLLAEQIDDETEQIDMLLDAMPPTVDDEVDDLEQLEAIDRHLELDEIELVDLQKSVIRQTEAVDLLLLLDETVVSLATDIKFIDLHLTEHLLLLDNNYENFSRKDVCNKASVLAINTSSWFPDSISNIARCGNISIQ